MELSNKCLNLFQDVTDGTIDMDKVVEILEGTRKTLRLSDPLQYISGIEVTIQPLYLDESEQWINRKLLLGFECDVVSYP